MDGTYDVVIIGSGPAGLGAAFFLSDKRPALRILILEADKFSSGGLRNDCKMNFTYPIGFPEELWDRELAEEYLALVESHLKPEIKTISNVDVYKKRAEKLGVSLLTVRQSHLGTDGGLELIKRLVSELSARGVDVFTECEVTDIAADEKKVVVADGRSFYYSSLLVAPGRKGFRFLQNIMDNIGVKYVDNVVDIGLRLELREEHYPIVADYYDPKFLFPEKVRTFCTNSQRAYVVKEKYKARDGSDFFSVNGHAYTKVARENGLVNFAMLRTVNLTEPLASGQLFAEMLGQQAMLLGGGKPIMQRVGDFRLGKRSRAESFSGDLYDFEPTLAGCTPGDISLAMPAKILRSIWKALKMLDTICPGVLHPGTIMYYPEIKLYANRPVFKNEYFCVKDSVFFAGDGAGTSRGITAAWASGIRAARGILETL
ncbi:NAD(P)/FAD-dependent oxidoreductase [Spirochaetia bacterium 38H-sp]|uniref:NAD(P)/FAD-dependent oxidoreductase n=1 Tax=Rarispira pelagica TaxID=3141764 RepID=A0ABU9UCP5_9SPIR